MIKSEKIITIHEPNDIYKVIEELNKGSEELGKLSLDEQMERLEKLEKKIDCRVAKKVNAFRCWRS
tara:strand:- start:277 stop:474 length:198 start_codon:yes stop_codon:yes gene_type:complete